MTVSYEVDRAGGRGDSVLGDITPVSALPPEAADRPVPGHWQGDPIVGAFNRSAIVTVVERQSRFMLRCDLPEGHDAQSETVGDLPDLMRRSLTGEQRRETAQWAQPLIGADVEVFFCDSHSPWQRPANEHMNGLLRRYLPKGNDLNRVSFAYLRHVAAEMNGRPRKILNWRTPAEVYAALVAAAACPRPLIHLSTISARLRGR